MARGAAGMAQNDPDSSMSQIVNTAEEVSGRVRAESPKKSAGISGRSLMRKLLPGLFGAGLYVLNNLDVLHGFIAPPAGYLPMGVQRNSDIAIYLTWLYGYGKGWLLPNYSAPWTTPAQFVAPGLLPTAMLQRVLHVSPVAALQIFSLLGYLFVAYALAFACREFCQTRNQKILAVLIALACVPMDALPLVARLFGAGGGRVHFLTLSDGFFRGLVTWPLITWGTGFQALCMGLLARYVKTVQRKWVFCLALACVCSTLLHPFEIFVTVTVVAIVFTRKFGISSESARDFAVICAAAGIGLFPYVFQTLRSAWMHEVANANSIVLSPAALTNVIGLPVLVALVLLLFGVPGSRSDEAVILKTWLLCSLGLFFVPGLPFALHVLDGSFIAIGLLLVMQIEELLARGPRMAKPILLYVGVPVLVWSLLPHAIVRAQAWDAGIATQNVQFPFDTCTTFHGPCLQPTAIAPAAEVATTEWLRQNANPEDLVLATEDAAPWVAQAPVHSFASHWLFSLLWQNPNYRNVRNAFFSGALTPSQGHSLLELIGARFVVVPEGSPAGQYLTSAMQRARFGTWTIYELPGARMKPFHDAGIVALGGGR